MEQSLLAAVGLDQRNLLIAPPGEAQIAQSFIVDRKNPARRSVFRRHVANGCAVGQWQLLQSGSKILNELADHAVLTQHFGDRKHQISCGCALAQASGQLHANHLRNQH